MSAKSITERAAELAKVKELKQRQELTEVVRKADWRKEELLKIFEDRFNSVLPLLRADEITWSAQMYDMRYDHKGYYIMFKRRGRATKMDINHQGAWKTKNSVFDHWDMDKFVSWIAQEFNLLDDETEPPHPSFEDGV